MAERYQPTLFTILSEGDDLVLDDGASTWQHS
jgi:hypothetical protein